MGKYLKKFENHTQYEEARQNLVLPNVSLCAQENEVHYNPYVPPYAGFCKLTLNNGNVVELEGSGELTSAMISNYKSTLVSAEIGTQCTSIGQYAFSTCTGLTSITIGSGVTSIGSSAFQYCSLTSVTIPNSVTSIDNGVFSACRSLTSVTIGNSVTSIGSQAFYQCSGLTSVTIPNSVTSIDSQAFYQCSGLTSITIGSGVTSIGSQAFYQCTGLTSVTIPDSVTSIAEYAFRNCSNLTSITSNAMTAPAIRINTFQNVKTNGTLTVPSGSSGYDVWMGTSIYYLGYYNWTKVEQ